MNTILAEVTAAQDWACMQVAVNPSSPIGILGYHHRLASTAWAHQLQVPERPRSARNVRELLRRCCKQPRGRSSCQNCGCHFFAERTDRMPMLQQLQLQSKSSWTNACSKAGAARTRIRELGS